MDDEHILQLRESFQTDESIRRYEYQEYQPITGANINAAGEIRIIIESQDEIFHPAQSFLLVEGQLVKSGAAAGAYADADEISLVNNGIMYLFQNIRYELSGHEIESLNHPGPATTMKGLLRYSDDFTKCQGMNQCWIKDQGAGTAKSDKDNLGFQARHDYIIEKPTPKGSFSFVIPLNHVFGFADDYDKVLYGLRHVLTLVRKGSSNDAIFRAGTAALVDGVVNLSKISWHMPRVLPNDQEKLKFMKIIESKETIAVGFRVHQCETIAVPESTTFSWRLNVKTSPESPRWVIVGFQTDKEDQQLKNSAVFDHCDAQSVWIELNGDPYPQLQHNTNFTTMQISTLYNAINNFQSRYYGNTNAYTNICPEDFKSMYPIHVINISKQSERLRYGVMDMNLRATFRTKVPAKTQAFALIISDRIVNFKSDGSKMNVTI